MSRETRTATTRDNRSEATISPRFPACIALTLAFLPGAQAWANDATGDPALATEGMHRVGSVYLAPSFQLKELAYDDNIFFDADGAVADVTATLSPGLSMVLRTAERGGVRLDQELDYVAFAEHTGENHWNDHTRIRGVYLPRRAFLAVEASYASRRWRPNLEVDDRIRQVDRGLGATFGTARGRRAGVELDLGHGNIDFSDLDPSEVVIRQRLARTEETLSLSGTYRILPKTSLVATFGLLDADFTDPTERRDSRQTRTLAGLRFDATARIQGEVLLGVSNLAAREQPDQDWHGFIADASLSGRVGRTSVLSGTYARGPEFSTLANNLYFVSTSGSLTWEQFLGRRFSLEIGLLNGRSDYPNEVLLFEPVLRIGERADRLREYSGVLRYRFHDGPMLDIGLRHRELDSTDDSLDRRQNVLALATGIEF